MIKNLRFFGLLCALSIVTSFTAHAVLTVREENGNKTAEIEISTINTVGDLKQVVKVEFGYNSIPILLKNLGLSKQIISGDSKPLNEVGIADGDTIYAQRISVVSVDNSKVGETLHLFSRAKKLHDEVIEGGESYQKTICDKIGAEEMGNYNFEVAMAFLVCLLKIEEHLLSEANRTEWLNMKKHIRHHILMSLYSVRLLYAKSIRESGDRALHKMFHNPDLWVRLLMKKSFFRLIYAGKASPDELLYVLELLRMFFAGVIEGNSLNGPDELLSKAVELGLKKTNSSEQAKKQYFLALLVGYENGLLINHTELNDQIKKPEEIYGLGHGYFESGVTDSVLDDLNAIEKITDESRFNAATTVYDFIKLIHEEIAKPKTLTDGKTTDDSKAGMASGSSDLP